jgi:hypothetical protein
MTTPGERPTERRRHRQIMDDRTLDQPDLTPKREDTWVQALIKRVAGAIRKVAGNRSPK